MTKATLQASYYFGHDLPDNGRVRTMSYTFSPSESSGNAELMMGTFESANEPKVRKWEANHKTYNHQLPSRVMITCVLTGNTDKPLLPVRIRSMRCSQSETNLPI